MQPLGVGQAQTIQQRVERGVVKADGTTSANSPLRAYAGKGIERGVVLRPNLYVLALIVGWRESGSLQLGIGGQALKDGLSRRL